MGKGSKAVYNNSVFWVSTVFITIVVLFGAIWPSKFEKGASAAFDFTTYAFGWFYLLAVLFFVLLLIFLALSKFGRIKLGPDGSKPDYPFFTWIGMLMSCGLGIGLVFWGVAEPMSHFFTSPFQGTDDLTRQAARTAMGYSFFHWGMSQWAIFAVVGLAVGFFQFRKNEDGLISTTIKPLIQKRRSKNTIKKVIDTLAVIATVVGVATSLGLGIMQINGGLTNVFGFNNNIVTHLGIVAVMLVCYLLSSITGLDKGIKWLSNFNLALIFIVMLYVFITGPTVFILNTFTQGLGDYVTHFIEYSLRLSPYTGDTWVREWTIFYWAWTIAWSPFVGAFIGRVSRGRTIREFVMGVLIIPPLISLLWIAVFGGTALHMDLFKGTNIALDVNKDVTSALFSTFNQLPLSYPLSIMAIILIFTFLVTSADSASYILGSMTTNGMSTPPIIVRVIWGILIAAIAAVLTIASGLEGLQTASLVAALPFTVILVLMSISIISGIKKEYRLTSRKK
ncbi:BCCT family transporter [Lederbergia lenta]|uniref:Glycine betaine transporter n=1 Tax=Lederbergia lenta TaxID=1467 RepID=A0A2X4WJT5_LEDLE|nr:BCCT family transporter [Lederbergia lenta]MCM3112128.1 BCCT family transporter [Lederbergia lenta]MEC2323299.1 BCCT family transporter [Lederbergia lenta]SQI63159.1 glycine betaine transporter [Lederbergia lenta]